MKAIMDMFGNEFSFIVYNKNRTMFDNKFFNWKIYIWNSLGVLWKLH